VRIAREALPFAVVLSAVSLAAGYWVHPLAALPGALLLGFVLWFFRDPERETPREDGLLVSPADGRVIRAGPQRVSVFMNVFNVHICRAPCSGRVEKVESHRGRFAAAFHDHASEHNERTSIVLADRERRLRFTLVAGLIARRIVCKVEVGQTLEAGQRIGLIQFGSRVDVDLPSGAEVTVSHGDRVVAGETPIARLS
jgi:phosphatidylserine decarboxylase